MMDDDFFLSDDDLGKDNQLSIVDDAKIKVLEEIKKSAHDIIENIKFNEKSDSVSNLRILSGLVGSLTDLFGVNSDDLADEEVQALIDNVLKATTELTFSNIDEIIKEDEENQSDSPFDSSDDSDSLDW